MILSGSDILRRQKEAVEKAKEGSHKQQTIANMIGHEINYLFAVRDILGVRIGVCGVMVRILNMYLKEDATTETENYFVDLAVETSISDFYTEMNSVEVTSISGTDMKGNSTISLCYYPDLDFVTNVINDRDVQKANRPKLQLVINKTDQETPDQQS